MSFRYYLDFSLIGIFSISYVFSATTYFDIETVSAHYCAAEASCEQPVEISRELENVMYSDTFQTYFLSESSTSSVSDTEKVSFASEIGLTSVSQIAPTEATGEIITVPFYSQFSDISDPEWRKVGCGVASLAMLIEFYEPNRVSVDKLLKNGIANGAFLSDAGWIHAGLINLAKEFDLGGESHSLANLSMETAFTELESVLGDGPVMASVHYTFDPQNPIPHLVVVNGVLDGKVYYNDPAEESGGGSISVAKFKSAWKQRYIEIRPLS